MINGAGSHCRILLIDIVRTIVVSESKIEIAIACCLRAVNRLRRHEIVQVAAARLDTGKLICERCARIDNRDFGGYAVTNVASDPYSQIGFVVFAQEAKSGSRDVVRREAQMSQELPGQAPTPQSAPHQ